MRTVVVGAGPAGLAVAYRLAQRSDVEVVVLERAPTLGGLAAGFRHGDYILDFGPHRLHPATDPTVLADLRRLLGDELELRPRRGQIRLDGRYLPYPLGPVALRRLGLGRLLHLGVGMVAARLARRCDAPISYEAYLKARFGTPFYQLFYGPYAEKVWGLPGHAIAADQAARRVNQRGLTDLLGLALGRGVGHWYFYPRGGFGRIPAVYAAAIAAAPSATIVAPTTVQAVQWRPGEIRAIWHGQSGGASRIDIDHLVWSAPVPELVRRLDPPAPSAVQAAVSRLRYRAVVLCYIALAVPRVGLADTYYFPEQRYPFNRVIEQKNFSQRMVPPDRTVLGLDLACDPDDPVFNASDDQLRDLVLPALVEAGLVQVDQVIEVFSRRFYHAYPVYDHGYKAALREILTWLADFPNLWLIGRQGLFLHNNTHHSLLMGYRAAEAIIAPNGRTLWPARLAEFATFRVAD